MPAVDVQLPRAAHAISLKKCYRTMIFQDQHCSLALGAPHGIVVEQSRIRADIDAFLLGLPESEQWSTSTGRDATKKELPLIEMRQAPYRLFLVSLNPMVVVATPQADARNQALQSAPLSVVNVACNRSNPCLTYPGRTKVTVQLTGIIPSAAEIKWFSPDFPERGMVTLPPAESAHVIRLPGLQGAFKQVEGALVFKREL